MVRKDWFVLFQACSWTRPPKHLIKKGIEGAALLFHLQSLLHIIEGEALLWRKREWENEI
jgi:hypothetical protein